MWLEESIDNNKKIIYKEKKNSYDTKDNSLLLVRSRTDAKGRNVVHRELEAQVSRL